MPSLQYANRILKLSIAIFCALADGAHAADSNPTGLPLIAPARSSKQLSAEQLDEVSARIKLANAIADHAAGDAQAKGLAPSWRIGLLASLYKLNSAQLRNIEPTAMTLDQAHALANAAREAIEPSTVTAKDLGSATDNLVFTPSTPCRFIDTRVTGGAISTPRDFDTELDGSSYGGDVGCTLPRLGEPALAANVTVVVGAGAAGYIGIRPYGTSNSTSFLNWPAGGTSGLANSGIITTALNASSHYLFEVFNGGRTNPQVIMDYFGYFAPANQIAMALDCVQTSSQYTMNGYVIASYNPPDCPAGYSQITALCRGSSNATILIGFGADDCEFSNSDVNAHLVNVGEVCCRVPAL